MSGGGGDVGGVTGEKASELVTGCVNEFQHLWELNHWTFKEMSGQFPDELVATKIVILAKTQSQEDHKYSIIRT